MQFKNKNLPLIQSNFEYLLPLEEYKQNYSIIKSKSNYPVPQKKIKQRWSSYHSLYSPEKEKISFNNDFPVILGMAGLYHIKSLLTEERPFILIEPDGAFFSFMVDNFDLSSLLEKKDITIIVGERNKKNTERLHLFFSPYLLGLPNPLQHQRSQHLSPESFSSWVEFIKDWKKRWQMEISTQKELGSLWFRNTIINSIYKTSKANKAHIKEEVLLLGAGTSIEKGIKEIIKQKKGKTLICADSLLPFLRSMNIKPDFSVTIDPQIYSYHHYIGDLETPVIKDISTQNFLERRCINSINTGNPNPLVNLLYPGLKSIDTSLGNVVGTTIDLLIQLGVKKIFLWGADFSFPLGKTHCRDTYLNRYFQSIETRLNSTCYQSYCFSIRDNIKNEDGSLSNEKMISYKKLLQSYLRNKKEVINFSEKSGNWEIEISPLFSKKPSIITNNSIKDCDIVDYLSKLKSLNMENNFTKQLPNWKNKDKQTLSTLFPLSARLLSKGVEDSLREARFWAVSKIEALLQAKETEA